MFFGRFSWPFPKSKERKDWGRQKGVTPICSDLFRFPRFLPICSDLRSSSSGSVPIWSDLLRFVPICFQNKSEQANKFKKGRGVFVARSGKDVAPYRIWKYSNPQNKAKIHRKCKKKGFVVLSVYFCPILLMDPFSYSLGSQLFPNARFFGAISRWPWSGALI